MLAADLEVAQRCSASRAAINLSTAAMPVPAATSTCGAAGQLTGSRVWGRHTLKLSFVPTCATQSNRLLEARRPQVTCRGPAHGRPPAHLRDVPDGDAGQRLRGVGAGAAAADQQRVLPARGQALKARTPVSEKRCQTVHRPQLMHAAPSTQHSPGERRAVPQRPARQPVAGQHAEAGGPQRRQQVAQLLPQLLRLPGVGPPRLHLCQHLHRWNEDKDVQKEELRLLWLRRVRVAPSQWRPAPLASHLCHRHCAACARRPLHQLP